MEQGNGEATRVMVPGGGPAERTIVQGGIAGATQMGQTTACAVCGTSNTALDVYCRDCGFLLASVPGEPVAYDPTVGAPVLRLVDPRSGRAYALRPGVNTVGREGADVLLLDGTVSRRHAEVTVEHETALVVDLSSTNGTQVNGDPLEPNRPRPARAGSQVTFGNTALTVEVETVESADADAGDEPDIGAAAAEEGASAAVRYEAPVEGAEPLEGDDSASRPDARLRSLSSDRGDIVIAAAPVTIGRKAGNTVMVAVDPYVSGHHAQIERDGVAIYLTDLGSTNGTTVNGQRLEASVRVQLSAGDEVAIGQGRYQLEVERAAPQDAADRGD